MHAMPQMNFEFDELMNGQVFHKGKPARTLLRIFHGNIGRLLLSYVFFTIKHSATWVMPIIIANIINIATEPGKHGISELWVNLAVAFVTVAQNVPMNVLYNKYLSIALRNVEAELRSNLVRKIQMLSISFHRQFQSGRIQSKIIRDVEAIVTLARQISNGLVPILINIVVVLCITFYKNPGMAVFFLASIPISFLVIRVFRRNIRSTNRNFRQQMENMSSEVAEMVEMVPLTRAHALESVEITRIDRQLEKIREGGYRLDIVTATFGASAWLATQVMQLLCLGFSGYLAYYHHISVGEVVLYQTYFTQILNQINSLINVYPDIMKGFESIHSVSEIFSSQDVERNSGKKKLRDIAGDVQFENVSFRYGAGQPPVLTDFSLHVRPGEHIAIVGESGAGKTTLLSLLIGFISPARGHISIDGEDMHSVNLASFRRNIAVVPQNTILFSGTIRQNITYGLRQIDETRLRQVVEAADLTDLVDRLPQGLDTPLGEHGDTLSGGQKQRISIARAMIRQPRIIILDEATSALDSISEAHVQKALRNLTRGRTTFLVAHRLTTVRGADRILVLKDGRQAECGSYTELMAQRGEFYRMENMQESC